MSGRFGVYRAYDCEVLWLSRGLFGVQGLDGLELWCSFSVDRPEVQLGYRNRFLALKSVLGVGRNCQDGITTRSSLTRPREEPFHTAASGARARVVCHSCTKAQHQISHPSEHGPLCRHIKSRQSFVNPLLPVKFVLSALLLLA